MVQVRWLLAVSGKPLWITDLSERGVCSVPNSLLRLFPKGCPSDQPKGLHRNHISARKKNQGFRLIREKIWRMVGHPEKARDAVIVRAFFFASVREPF
jgi:hypothetical protein